MGFIRHILIGLCASVLIVAICSATAWAQRTTSEITPPEFTVETLSGEIEALPEIPADEAESNASLEVEQIRTFLATAITRLEAAALQSEARQRFSTNADTARQTVENLQAELETLRNDLDARTPMDAEATVVGDAAMFETEQELLSKESELRAVEEELEQYRTQLSELGTRLSAAPRELNDARSALGEITSTLSELSTGDVEPVLQARQKALQASAYNRRLQIAALEAEIASLPIRQDILTLRRNIAELQAEALGEDVLALQALTGQRRQIEAEMQATRLAYAASTFEGAHPLIQSLAQENVRMADTITEMAAGEAQTSRRLATIRGETANVQNDLYSAQKLVDLEAIDREAGATLRRVSAQLTPVARLRADQRDIQRDLARVTRARVVAQEQLRDLPLRSVDPSELLADARLDDPTIPDLAATDEEVLRDLVEQRRDLLRQTASIAAVRENALAELAVAQDELVAESDRLRLLLDGNLLWVPSVPAIGFDWPQKVILGAAELFSPGHVQLAVREFVAQSTRLWPLIILAAGMIFAIFRLRPSLWDNVERCGEAVGRVKRDSLWHTPVVILTGFVLAMPWPIAFGLLALLFMASNNPDPLVQGLGDAFAFAALTSLIFATWCNWDRDKSLFDEHFKLSKPLREAVLSNLRWFAPLAGTAIFGLALTEYVRAPNVLEGLSLAIFIALALSVAVFSFRVLWRQRSVVAAVFGDENSGLARWRTPITIIIVGVPIGIAILAGAGWYESAKDLLWRVFMTAGLLLMAYVVYGTLRRAINVSQRQIKYRQALERRENQIKLRREQEEAEARGEDMPAAPPPVDTSEIDVSVMSRQSAQLLRVFVVLGLAVLLWFNWADLFPALTVFDGNPIAVINEGQIDAEGRSLEKEITVFTIMMAMVIVGVTVIAARNLPGFLEIFVLSRVGVDAGARYAITTILGYIIVGTGIVLAFQRVGLQWSQLRWIVTGLSVGIGFGLQKIIANFVSGLILLFERPIRIGDYVTIGTQSGTVTRIKIRATTLIDLDNREILIPNENLISQEVTNWTLSNATTRLVCTVGIAYGSDTEKARDLMLEVLKSNPKVLETPPPAVLFTNFGDSSLDFELRAFLRVFEDRWPVKHQIHTEVNRALAEAGIEIPFPQRDLNIRTQDVPLQVAPPAIKAPKSADYEAMVDPNATGKAAE